MPTVKEKGKAPNHRKRGRITLEQFRQHREAGIGVREMPKKLGVSKNFIQFLSAMDQGKFLHVTEEAFHTDYMDGVSLEEIAKKHGVSYDYIGFLREHFGIERMGAKFINRKKTEKPLTARQKEIIYGSLMGDAGKMSNASVKMKQSTKQKPYLLWKYGELEEHCSPKSLQEEEQYDKRYKKIYHQIRFYTHANTDIEEIVSKFYPDGQKKITQDILDHLTGLSVAVWFMDDGTTDWKQRQIKNGVNANPSAKICTDSFSKLECHLIADWFKTCWGITARVATHNKEKTMWRLFFSTADTPKFFALIRPHVIPEMMYKITPCGDKNFSRRRQGDKIEPV